MSVSTVSEVSLSCAQHPAKCLYPGCLKFHCRVHNTPPNVCIHGVWSFIVVCTTPRQMSVSRVRSILPAPFHPANLRSISTPFSPTHLYSPLKIVPPEFCKLFSSAFVILLDFVILPIRHLKLVFSVLWQVTSWGCHIPQIYFRITNHQLPITQFCPVFFLYIFQLLLINLLMQAHHTLPMNTPPPWIILANPLNAMCDIQPAVTFIGHTVHFDRHKSVSVEPKFETSSRASHDVVYVVFLSCSLHFLYNYTYVVTLNTHRTAGIKILMTNQIKFYKALSPGKGRVTSLWMSCMSMVLLRHIT
jgi:hypothetical protein